MDIGTRIARAISVTRNSLSGICVSLTLSPWPNSLTVIPLGKTHDLPAFCGPANIRRQLDARVLIASSGMGWELSSITDGLPSCSQNFWANMSIVRARRMTPDNRLIGVSPRQPFSDRKRMCTIWLLVKRPVLFLLP